jgi:hypothetical protein
MRVPRWGPRVGGLIVLVIAPTALAACGSSRAASNGVPAICTQISAVLSDGPDPGVDPVGHAEAQILPLHQLTTSDPSLQSAIDDLASAYQSVTSTDNSKAANQAVATASSSVDKICPGATS